MIWETSALMLAGACRSPTGSSKCESMAPRAALQSRALPARWQLSAGEALVLLLVWIIQSQLSQESLRHDWWYVLCVYLYWL